MQIHKITLTVIDFDCLGGMQVRDTIENARYPNDCVSPIVLTVETREIGKWSDDNPLNHHDTYAAEVDRLFGAVAPGAQA